MRIRTEQLKEGTLSLAYEEPPETYAVLAEMVKDGTCEFTAPLKAALRARQIGDIVEVEGDISTAVRLDCARCLQLFELPLATDFVLTYTRRESGPEPTDPQPEDLELTAEDIGLIYYTGDEINLKNEIQEQVILAFPFRAICKPNCKGLCPGCGTDLNSGACQCDPSPSGGKFAALKNFKLE